MTSSWRGRYRPVPPGEYKVQITSSEFCQTSTGNGHQLKLEMEILECDQAGRDKYQCGGHDFCDDDGDSSHPREKMIRLDDHWKNTEATRRGKP